MTRKHQLIVTGTAVIIITAIVAIVKQFSQWGALFTAVVLIIAYVAYIRRANKEIQKSGLPKNK
jgi:uncharacterized membrane protein YobD (UPF0266 family)